MAFLYETHLHTKEGSVCGVSPGREYVRKYLDLGYTGIIVTDHFFRGNCRVDRNYPWNKWVDKFCSGYENAREEGARLGLDVFFGWEETIGENDYLVYGLDKDWLLEHPEVIDWDQYEQFEEVRRHGGCVVHAHPYRYSRHHDKSLSAAKRHVHAIEAANFGNCRSSNILAFSTAKKMNVTATAGSDIHSARDILLDNVFGVYLDKKMETIADYVNAVLNNNISSLKVPRGYFKSDSDS